MFFCSVLVLSFTSHFYSFLTSSSATKLCRGCISRLTSNSFTFCHTKTITSVPAGQVLLTRNQPEGSGSPKWQSNPRPPDQESCALPTRLPNFFKLFCKLFLFLNSYQRQRPRNSLWLREKLAANTESRTLYFQHSKILKHGYSLWSGSKVMKIAWFYYAKQLIYSAPSGSNI